MIVLISLSNHTLKAIALCINLVKFDLNPFYQISCNDTDSKTSQPESTQLYSPL